MRKNVTKWKEARYERWRKMGSCGNWRKMVRAVADGVKWPYFDRWREMARVVANGVKWREMWQMA